MTGARRSAGVRASSVVALALACLLGACRSSADGKPTHPFDMVQPPVAFEMLRDNPRLPVLDLRTRYEFSGPAGHIRGARNVPLDELPLRLSDLAGLKARTFLIYCGHDDCGLRALEILRKAGFDEAVLMDGGLDRWVAGGFGTVVGPPPPMYFPEEDSEEVVVD